jgi:hypothetical protein
MGSDIFNLTLFIRIQVLYFNQLFSFSLTVLGTKYVQKIV